MQGLALFGVSGKQTKKKVSYPTTEVKIINIFVVSIAFQKVAWTPSARTLLRGKSEGAFFFQLSLCPCLKMVTTAASLMSSGISSSFSSFEMSARSHSVLFPQPT